MIMAVLCSIPSILIILPVLLIAVDLCSGLAEKASPPSVWRPLPHPLHFDRREILVSGAALAATGSFPKQAAAAAAAAAATNPRTAAKTQSHLVIPVWPSWGGGRVVPVSLAREADPFLLLAHHKHWFDPNDPLREPFKDVGKALGLPYVDVEGFKMHPHRGMDIWTYVLDGSDGFCHKDSLNTQERIYRGGCAQWMRTGAGVMHEEFWETRPDRRTDIELFQLWVNLPASQKFDSPAVRYIGADDDTTTPPWIEEQQGGVRVRNVSRTLDFSLAETEHHNNRPPVEIQHVQIPPRTSWETSTIPRSHSAMVYVREGVATLEGGQTVAALQSASFSSNSGDTIRLDNSSKQTTLDVLLLSGQPLREPVALGGPIVMNTEQELYDAYQQLSDGTFLDRDVALRQQALSRRRMMHGNA